MLTHSARLRAKITLTSGEWLETCGALWRRPDLGALFPEYLFRIHCIIRTSVPLMQTAHARARELAAGDRVAAALAEYLAHHIPEERGHDDWLLEDLTALGWSRDEVLARLPPPAVAELTGAQYYWIAHVHPVALVGYIAVSEGNPPRRDRLDEVIARTGLPKAAFRTLFKHSQLDVRHSEDLDRMLDALPLSESHTALIGISAFRTVHGLHDVMRDLMSSREPAMVPAGRG